MKKISYIDKSVRDHNQQAIIFEDSIKIVSKYGRKKVEDYLITRKEWDKTFLFGNPNYTQFQLILSKTRHYDNQPGGECQAGRIRDSQIRAIKEALLKENNLKFDK